MFATILPVALGGAVGASARFLIGLAAPFPFGTLTVNILGSFLMGVAFVFFADKGLDRWALMVTTGVLGGFTTFSTFSLDVLRLYEAGRVSAAGGYVLVSVVLSLVAIFVAVAVMRGVQG